MARIRMSASTEKTFADGFEEYIFDMKSRNLRQGTIKHYEKFYNSCLSMIAQIARNHGAFDEQWADNPFCVQLYDIIGTGHELQDFKMLRLEISEPMKQYPNPAEQAHFDFHFKPVQRNEQSANMSA